MAKRHLTGRQLRWLFASGVLKGKGRGKDRTVTYDKARAATVSRNRKRGVDVTSRKGFTRKNTSGRFVFGGSKAAPLRSGAGSGRRVPGKAERDATRAARIARGLLRRSEFQASARGQQIKEQFSEIVRRIGAPAFKALSRRDANKLRVATYRPAGRTRERDTNATRVARALQTVKAQQRKLYAPPTGVWTKSDERRRASLPETRQRYAQLKRREERIVRLASHLGVATPSRSR